MCKLTYFQHKECNHTWAVVTTPCAPFRGFTNCPSFGNGALKESPSCVRTRSRPCPRCQLRGAYDRNMVRMVSSMGWGLKWGVGPGAEDYGCEIKMPGNGPCVML